MTEQPDIWVRRQQQYDRYWLYGLIGIWLVAGLGLWLSNRVSATNSLALPSLIPAVESSRTDNPSTEIDTAQSTQSSRLLNLRTATAGALEQLDGIGAKRAEQIVILRDQGKIKSIADLKQVKGIGEKTFASFKDKLTWE